MTFSLMKSLADRVSDQGRDYAEASARIRSRALSSFYVNPFAVLGAMLGLPVQATADGGSQPAPARRRADRRARRTRIASKGHDRSRFA